MRVPYRIPGSNNVQWVDLYTRLAFERIIFLNNAIDDNTANSVVALMLYLESEDNTKPINLYINSPGDAMIAGMASTLSAGMAIYDTMQHLKSPVHTICLGQAVGSAAMLLSSGVKGFRASLPHAEIVLNPFYSRTRGQASDIQIYAKRVLEDKHTLLGLLSHNTGQTTEKIAKDLDRTFYLTPTEAKEYGLIDRVVESTKHLQQPAAVLT
jgi:ATP-dependent Clp protease, protease subunit